MIAVASVQHSEFEKPSGMLMRFTEEFTSYMLAPVRHRSEACPRGQVDQ